MSKKDMERMKQLIEQKKTKNKPTREDLKVGSGSVEKKNKNIRIGWEGSKKISQ